MKNLGQLRDALDIVILRIESGLTLLNALDDAPRFRCAREWGELWIELRRRVQNGEGSALDALVQFRKSVDLELRVRRLVAKRSLLPVAQAAAVGLSALLFLLATQTLFGDIFRLQPLELLAVLGLMGFGAFWISYLMRAYRRDLWFLEWLDFVSALASRLSWGQSLLVAWRQGLVSLRKMPDLKKFLETSYELAQNYEPLPERSSGARDKRLLHCQTRWAQVHRLFIANERVLPLLQKELDRAFDSFQDDLEKNAELLSVKLMLPLFGCFAPAYLLMLLAPLIRPLWQAEP
jgi:hypothetical protein